MEGKIAFPPQPTEGTMTETLDTLWYTRCSVPTPVSLAALAGWIDQEFASDGITVKSLRESTDAEEPASHFEHSLPNSFRQGGSVPPIWARAKGQDTKVIAISWTDEFQAIIALPGSGIRSAKDLRGRRIGIPKHSITIDHNRASSLRAFIVALELEGLSIADVERVDLPDPGLLEGEAPIRRFGRRGRHSYTNESLALARGEVDAIYVKDVRGHEVIRLLGAEIIADLGFHPDPFVRISNCAPRPLTVNRALIEEHPDVVTRFLTRVVAAGERAASHPGETVARISEETGWSERAIRQAFGDQVHLHLRANLDEAWVKGLGQFKDFLFEHKFIPADFAIGDWVDPLPLSRVSSLADRKVA